MFLIWATLLTSLVLTTGALVGWWRRRHPLDCWYLTVLLPFASLAGMQLLASHGTLAEPVYVVASRVSYQLMILGVTAFNFVLMRARPMHVGVLVMQSIAGLMLAIGLPTVTLPGGMTAWELVNTAGGASLLLALAYALWRAGPTHNWILLVMAITALGVMVSDLHAAGLGAVSVSWPQLFFAPVILVVWLNGSGRLGSDPLQLRGHRERVVDRQQMARDLHDGVGSHLSTIISALDAGSADQKLTAAQLRECMVELKLLVDGAEVDVSALSLLASLRYRMQPLFDAAGVHMQWQMSNEAVLERIRGSAARQILRIAQEALANIVRHARASRVTVTCRNAGVSRAIVLEISDNGVGLPAALYEGTSSHLGKGLLSMEQRARELNGQLRITALEHGQGTRLELLVPIAALE